MCIFGGSKGPKAPVNSPSEAPDDAWKLVETRTSKLPTMSDQAPAPTAAAAAPRQSRAMAQPKGGAGVSTYAM